METAPHFGSWDWVSDIRKLSDMQLPIPTGAPTIGTAAVIFWTLFGLACLLYVAQRLFPTGNQRLAERRRTDDNAIEILKAQVAELRAEVTELRGEVERMSAAEKSNREYRHALANQLHFMQAWAENAYRVFDLIFKEWPACPEHIHEIIGGMGRPGDILARYPLPKVDG